MTVISKTAGVLGLVSTIREIHRNALIYSRREITKASADTFISNSLATQRTNRLSSRDTDRKKWLARKNLLAGPNEVFASVKGYLTGIFNGVVTYFPQLLLSGLAFGINKNHKVLANLCAAALAVVEGADFITNSLSSGQKNDYLQLKQCNKL